jgi:hypothetical protein
MISRCVRTVLKLAVVMQGRTPPRVTRRSLVVPRLALEEAPYRLAGKRAVPSHQPAEHAQPHPMGNKSDLCTVLHRLATQRALSGTCEL